MASPDAISDKNAVPKEAAAMAASSLSSAVASQKEQQQQQQQQQQQKKKKRQQQQQLQQRRRQQERASMGGRIRRIRLGDDGGGVCYEVVLDWQLAASQPAVAFFAEGDVTATREERSGSGASRWWPAPGTFRFW